MWESLGLTDTVLVIVAERHCVDVPLPVKLPEGVCDAEGEPESDAVTLPDLLTVAEDVADRQSDGEPLEVGEALGQRLPLGEGDRVPEAEEDRQCEVVGLPLWEWLGLGDTVLVMVAERHCVEVPLPV